MAQARQVDVSNQHLGTHTGSDDRSVGTYDTTTQNQYACGQYTRHTTHQFALASLRLLQESGTLLD